MFHIHAAAQDTVCRSPHWKSSNWLGFKSKLCQFWSPKENNVGNLYPLTLLRLIKEKEKHALDESNKTQNLLRKKHHQSLSMTSVITPKCTRGSAWNQRKCAASSLSTENLKWHGLTVMVEEAREWRAQNLKKKATVWKHSSVLATKGGPGEDHKHGFVLGVPA